MYDKRFFLSFRGYSKGHHIQANLNEISGGVEASSISFSGKRNLVLFSVESQRGHGAKTENLGPFAVTVSLWARIKLFQILQH